MLCSPSFLFDDGWFGDGVKRPCEWELCPRLPWQAPRESSRKTSACLPVALQIFRVASGTEGDAVLKITDVGD